MKRKWLETRQSIRIKRQLYFVYILSIFIPVLLLGASLIYNNYRQLYQHHEEILESDHVRVRSILFEVTTSVVNICDNIAESPELQNLISNQYRDYNHAHDQLMDFGLMQDYFGRYTEISDLTLYTNNTTLHDYGHIRVINDELRKEEWYQKAISNRNYNWITRHRSNEFGVEHDELVLTYQIPILGKSEFALLAISISNNYLKNRIDNNMLDVDVQVGHDYIFYSTNGHTGKENPHLIDFQQAFYRSKGMEEYFGDKALIEVSTLKPMKGITNIYITSTNRHAREEIFRILRMTIGILLLSMLVPFLIIVRFTAKFSERIDTLREAMHSVSDGNYQITENFRGNDELMELFRDLKKMIQNIKERDHQIFESRIQEQKLINHQQKMEMELLSSKINPHFLYNTLETIRMKAFSAGNKEVAQAVKLLGKYMRYNLESTGGLTDLESELLYIDIYLKIQKLRFASKINYQILIDEKLNAKHYPILPLLLQPIVENAILHGLRETVKDGEISIEVMRKEEQVHIRIKDNGCGMEKGRLLALRAYINDKRDKESHSMGLQNITQRIKLYYGENYGMSIDSEEDKGSIFTLILPYEVKVVE
ncbi:MAG: sensor histidine kinase [Vallitaleaceae bacterium]|nr:sensor histidine kinase [Vallitaleaceae bacterium]